MNRLGGTVLRRCPLPSGEGRRPSFTHLAFAALALLLLLTTGPASHAQDSTSVAAPEAPETLALRDTTAGDSTLIAPSVPASGRAASPVPAVTPALDLGDLLARADGLSLFAYGLGAPGRLAGLSFDGLAPTRAAVTLDGRPLSDLFTGTPRLDLVPWEATDRLVLQDAEVGAPIGVGAALRPFRERVPVTELRFHTGRLGIQTIAGTHAQTHRAPWRLGGEKARFTATFHVGSRQSDGAVSGARLRHTHVLARLALATPRWGAEITEHYAERTEGARRGVLDDGAFFDPFRASVLDPSAERRTLRNELAATLRAPLVSAHPLALWASWTRQTSRYSPGASFAVPTPDTLALSGNRYAAGLSQRLGRGPTLRAHVGYEDEPWGARTPLRNASDRLQAHAALADTLTLGPARLAATLGGHVVGSTIGPALAVRAEAGLLSGALSWTGVVPGRIEDAGFFPAPSVAAGTSIGTADRDEPEQIIAAEISARARAGDLRFGVRPFAKVYLGAYRLVEELNVETTGLDTVVFRYSHSRDAVSQIGAQTTLTWREGTEAGLYARSSVTATAWPGASDSLGLSLSGRMAEALPALHGSARLGVRATRVGTGTAALDLGATVRGWTAFRGVRVHPATGLLALARTDAPRLPARALLDLDARVTFGTRATVAVTWANVFSGLVYDGARTVQGEPLPGRHLRFGVFWAFTE
ncbi:MAG: TonB-dependent receptor [Bacteroidota bacterium]